MHASAERSPARVAIGAAQRRVSGANRNIALTFRAGRRLASPL